MAHSLLKSWNLPAFFWGEAVATAVFLLNRAPTKAVDGMTPYEAWHGRRPDVHYLRTFGCVAYIKATKPHLKKLDDRGTPAVFIGYEPGAKAWRFYDPASRRAVVSRDAVFNEPASWTWEDEDMGAAADLVIKYHAMELGNGHFSAEVVADSPEPPATPAAGTPATSPATSTPAAATPAPPASPLPQPEFISPPPNAEEYWDADNDDVEPRYRTVDNILGAATAPGFAARQVAAELHLQIEEEPATFAEAEQHQSWRHAMLEEMNSIESN